MLKNDKKRNSGILLTQEMQKIKGGNTGGGEEPPPADPDKTKTSTFQAKAKKASLPG